LNGGRRGSRRRIVARVLRSERLATGGLVESLGRGSGGCEVATSVLGRDRLLAVRSTGILGLDRLLDEAASVLRLNWLLDRDSGGDRGSLGRVNRSGGGDGGGLCVCRLGDNGLLLLTTINDGGGRRGRRGRAARTEEGKHVQDGHDSEENANRKRKSD